jgi:hypothetical protein
MAYDLSQAVNLGGHDEVEKSVVQMFEEESPLIRLIPFRQTAGRTYTYNVDTALPGIAWRAINSSWTESTGAVNPTVERSYILGGESKLDIYLEATEPGGGVSLESNLIRQKVQAASNEFSRAVLEGDQGADPNALQGLRRRLAGNQVTLQATNGGPLTLAQLNVMMDSVIGPDSSKLLLMSKQMNRKLTDLVNAFGGSVLLSYELDTFGKRMATYRGVKIAVIETRGDASSILAYDETEGSSNVTASIYCVYLDGDDGMGAFYSGSKVLRMRSLGEQQASPTRLWRMEFYPGIYLKQARAAARLRGITAA